MQPILTGSCASSSCHGGVKPSADLRLEAGAAWGALVNQPSSCGSPYVTPGAPSLSYLMNKLDGIAMCSGNKMPKTGSISDADRELIRSWICRGAAND